MSSQPFATNSSSQVTVSFDVWPIFPVCAWESWQTIPFLNNRPHINLTDKDDWRLGRFIVEYAIPPAATSLAFFSLAALLLIAFLLWRGIHLVVLCFGKCTPKTDAINKDFTQSKLILAFKIIGLFACIVILVTAIIGLVYVVPSSSVHTNVVLEGWRTISAMVAYVSEIIRALSIYVDVLRIVSARLLITTGIATTIPGAPDVIGDVEMVVDTIRDVSGRVASFAASINASVIGKYVTLQDNWMQPTLQAWDIIVVVGIVVYALVLLFMVIHLFCSIFNYKVGVSVGSSIQGFFSVIFFALAIVLAIGLAALKDSCNDMEGVIVQVAPPDDLRPMFRWYLNRFSDPADTDEIWAATMVDMTKVDEELVLAVLNIRRRYQEFVVNVTNSNDNARLAAVIANLTSTSDLIRDALYGAAGVDRDRNLFRLISLLEFQINYDGSKAYLCCTVPALAARMWITLTILGWASMALVVVGIVQLHLLDSIPQSRYWCACDCFHPWSPIKSKKGGGKSSISYVVDDPEGSEGEALEVKRKADDPPLIVASLPPGKGN